MGTAPACTGHTLTPAEFERRLVRAGIRLLKYWFSDTEVHKEPILLPEREHHEHYSRQAVPVEMLVPEVY
jgi:hypothetical protein